MDFVSAPAHWIPLLHLDRDFQLGGISRVPFLDVKRADYRRFALGLHLRELHGVLGVFFFDHLNRSDLFRHNLIVG